MLPVKINMFFYKVNIKMRKLLLKLFLILPVFTYAHEIAQSVTYSGFTNLKLTNLPPVYMKHDHNYSTITPYAPTSFIDPLVNDNEKYSLTCTGSEDDFFGFDDTYCEMYIPTSVTWTNNSGTTQICTVNVDLEIIHYALDGQTKHKASYTTSGPCKVVKKSNNNLWVVEPA